MAGRFYKLLPFCFFHFSFWPRHSRFGIEECPYIQICDLQEREKLVAKVTRAWGNFGHHFHVNVTAKNFNFKDFLANKFLPDVFEGLFGTITKSF